MTIYVDGSGWDGRESKWCVQIGRQLPVITISTVKYTSNEAEYMALITALQDERAKNAEILSDSQLIVNQVNGAFRVKEQRLRAFHQQATNLIEKRGATLRWISREVNAAGKALER